MIRPPRAWSWAETLASQALLLVAAGVAVLAADEAIDQLVSALASLL